MTWVKLDDCANEHAKQVDAGGEACWLWACGLMYCNRQKTKVGFIPAKQVCFLYAGYSKEQANEAANELAKVGLWERVDGGYQVHDYGDYQPCDLSQVRAMAGKVGGLRSAEKRRAVSPSKNEANREANGQATVSAIAFARARRDGTGSVNVSDSNHEKNDTGQSAESGHDMAKRLWDPAWAKRWGEPYTYAPTMGQDAPDRILQRLGALAHERAPAGFEAWLAGRIDAYLADAEVWLVGQRHPLRSIEGRISKYASGDGGAGRPLTDLDVQRMRGDAARKSLAERA